MILYFLKEYVQLNVVKTKIIRGSQMKTEVLILTFILLGDETTNSSFVERGRSLMDPPHPLLHFLVRMKLMSTNVFFQVAKNVKVTRGKIWALRRLLKCLPGSLSLTKLAVRGRALSCKRMIPSDSITGRFDFMARGSTLSHQETNHT